MDVQENQTLVQENKLAENIGHDNDNNNTTQTEKIEAPRRPEAIVFDEFTSSMVRNGLMFRDDNGLQITKAAIRLVRNIEGAFVASIMEQIKDKQNAE